jgi:predicted nucleic acid-binding protein
MTGLNEAVLDNTAFRCLYELSLLKHLNLIYHTVWIPRQVEKEFLSIADISKQTARFNFLLHFYAVHYSWFKPCYVYNEDDIQLFLADFPEHDKKLHRGEVEAIVQSIRLPGTNIDLIIDELQARKFVRQQQMPVHGTLYLLAKMDICWGVCDYHRSVMQLIDGGQRYTISIAEKVYNMIKEELL